MSTVMKGDASGRGAVDGYRISIPARQRPYTEEEISAVVHVMRDCPTQTQGPMMLQFQQDFAAYTGANHAFAVANATHALSLAATLCGVGPGDEVIIPAYTFCASAIPFGKAGAKIVWGDINPDTWTIDPEDIRRKITPKTKAIVCVHLLGMPCDMPAIMAIAREHGLRVVEDCAQALDARINSQHVGSFGDFGCFSFHGAKTMTTLGEGGMLTVKSDADARLTPGIRHNGCCGFDFPRDRYWLPAMSNVDVDIDGFWPNNFCIGEAQCALGSVQLKTLAGYSDTIIAQNDKLRALLADVPEISFNKIPAGYRHVRHQYVQHFDGSAFGKNRDDLMDLLTTKYGIRSIVQYYPLYRYPLFQKLGAGAFDCPVLESWWDNTFSVPMWIGMTDEELEIIAGSIKSAIADLKA
ncbi:MAG: DegT/DnrJ/EryC1/StrS family aminotransferase [Oscillospiraceae bacterium]|nr:DegT/DnrJ/EryC1/StrS family aminotransferase [Oscillospiraceae bacterium]